MAELVNDTIGGIAKGNVIPLNRQCIASKNASLANILDHLQSQIKESEGYWGDAVVDLAALKAVAEDDRYDKQVRICEMLGIYRFDSTSSASGDDLTVIVPTAGTGRWLLLSPLTDVFDIGGCGYDFVRFTGVPNVDDAFTIAGRSYEWDTTGAGVNLTRTPGNVSASLDSAVTEINADAAATVKAFKLDGAGAGNGVLLLVSLIATTNFALVVTVDVGVTMTVNAANSFGDKAKTHRQFSDTVHVFTAQEILALAAAEGIIIAQFPHTSPPTSFNIIALDATNHIIPINGYTFEWVQPGSNFWALQLVDPAGAIGNFVATDQIIVQAAL